MGFVPKKKEAARVDDPHYMERRHYEERKRVEN
jgi:hypothetical protein